MPRATRPCLLLADRLCCALFVVLAHVVASCRAAVLGAGWPPRAGLARFWRTGRTAGERADVPETPAHPGRSEPPGRGGPFPGTAQVGGQRTGKAELGVAHDDQPGPPVSGPGVADLRRGPAQDLLEQPKGVFQVKPAQERLPEPVHLLRACAGARGPQPHRLGVAVAGQVIDLQADQGAFDDGQFAVVMIFPGGAVGEPGMQPVPGLGHGGAIPGGLGGGGHRGNEPAGLIGQLELPAVPGWPAPAAPPWRRREVQHPVRAQPAQQFHGQAGQQVRQPGHVIPGVEDDQDVRVALMPVPGLDQPGHHLADLGGGHLGLIITRPEANRVQHRGPRRAARFQRGHHRVRPARDYLRVALAPPVHMAEQPIRAGSRVWPQPVTHVHGQPDPPIGPAGQRQARQRPAQPPDLHPAAVHRVIQGAMAALMLRRQRQAHQGFHRPVRAQHRVRQFEQRIRPRGEAPVQLPAEGRQPVPRLTIIFCPRLDFAPGPRDTECHGHRLCLQVL